MTIKNLGRRAVLGLSSIALAAGMLGSSAAMAQDVTIPIIVKDTTSFYWQIVLAGARQAGKDLSVNVPELGAQAETDIGAEGGVRRVGRIINYQDPAAIVAGSRLTAAIDRTRTTKTLPLHPA